MQVLCRRPYHVLAYAITNDPEPCTGRWTVPPATPGPVQVPCCGPVSVDFKPGIYTIPPVWRASTLALVDHTGRILKTMGMQFSQPAGSHQTTAYRGTVPGVVAATVHNQNAVWVCGMMNDALSTVGAGATNPFGTGSALRDVEHPNDGWQLHLMKHSDLMDNYQALESGSSIEHTHITIQTTYNLRNPFDLQAYPQELYSGGKCMLAFQPNALNCTGLSGVGFECKMGLLRAHVMAIDTAIGECTIGGKASGRHPFPEGGATSSSACGQWAALAHELDSDFTAALDDVIHFFTSGNVNYIIHAVEAVMTFVRTLIGGVYLHPQIQCLIRKASHAQHFTMQEDLLWVGYSKMDRDSNGQSFAYYVGCDGELLGRVGDIDAASARRRRRLAQSQSGGTAPSWSWRRAEQVRLYEEEMKARRLTDSGNDRSDNGNDRSDNGNDQSDNDGEGDGGPSPPLPAPPLMGGLGQMQLSKWATGFTFMLNTFLEPVAVIARCDGEANGRTQPCATEYHKYFFKYTENNQYMGCESESDANLTDAQARSACTGIRLDFSGAAAGDGGSLAVSIKVPPAISGIGYDASVTPQEGYYADGRYLVVSFSGMTTEHVAGTNEDQGEGQGVGPHLSVGSSLVGKFLGSPEDRIHTLIAPILQTHAGESIDSLEAQLLGINLFTPKEITCDLAKGPGCKKGGSLDHITHHNSGSGRRLTQRAVARARRQLSSTMFVDTLNCQSPISFSFPLMRPIIYKPLMQVPVEGVDGLVFFTIVIPGVMIQGQATIHISFTLNLEGDLCLFSRVAAVAVAPQASANLIAQMSCDLTLIRGTLRVNPRPLIIVAFQPYLIIDFNEGPNARLDLYLTFPHTELCFQVALQHLWLKTCHDIPCGMYWATWRAWNIVCVPLMPAETFLLVQIGGTPADTTPPTSGPVRLQQAHATGAAGNITLHFSGFIELNSKVLGMQLLVSNRPYADSGGYTENTLANFASDNMQVAYVQHWLAGHNSMWSGLLSTMPASGETVYMCATAVNSAKINTTNCTGGTVWDLDPPTVEMWLWNPANHSYYQPECREVCKGGGAGCRYPPNISMCDTAFTSERQYVQFQLRIRDTPVASEHTIASLSWALRETHYVANTDPNASDLVFVFAEELDKPHLLSQNPLFHLSSSTFALEHGHQYWIHVHACDVRTRPL